MKKTLVIALTLTALTGLVFGNYVITSPSTGQKLTKNFSHDIKWTPLPVQGNVKIRLFKNNVGLGAIVLSTQNDGIFKWNMGQLTNGTPIGIGENYHLKIIAINNKNVTGFSGLFSIRELLVAKLPPGLLKNKVILKLNPDLIISSITVSKYNPSVKTTFTVNVKNIGRGTAGASALSVWFYKLLPNGQQPSTPNEFWSGTVPSGGGTISFLATVPWKHDKYEFMTEGNFRVTAKINPMKTVTESNYNNNEYTYNFSIPN